MDDYATEMGLALATIVLPGLGIAIVGTALAGWWLVVAFFTVLSALCGNRVGIGREKAALLLRAKADEQID
ncbi:hypothetical protein [Mesorhizobium sp. WSM2561]|uniref:hypothetical protein n=1 Tax=Mesorhizobium sp. WSM2561 TaxID=1040985 RepID=UPI0012EB5C19|nr:hypothetical protein [Mesorhizobium sp. WSM2561]